MAPLRSTQFYEGTPPAAATTLLYTVPTGHVIILKAAHVANQGSTAKILGLNLTSSLRILTWTLQASGAAGSTADWAGWMVLNPAETLLAVQQSGGSIHLSLSGYLLYI